MPANPFSPQNHGYFGPNFSATATPEPGLYGMLSLGLVGLFFAARRSRSTGSRTN
jgi:hypothetical protein